MWGFLGSIRKFAFLFLFPACLLQASVGFNHFLLSPLGRHGTPSLRQLQSEASTTLWSSVDDDFELIEEEDFSSAPRTERDSYVSEAEQAQRANDFVASQPSVELQTEISNSFLQYALSIIMGRAIPDARDGLKPVHRRILYAMDQLSLKPSGSHRKCARVVGEVLGKYHPHGDIAVYDALVRLAQDFSTNHPLIDGQGNFGSIDADPAAAMRYTECRLTRLSEEALLHDLNDDTVDFTPNFDGNENEPTILPARMPILLLNGASGIAVGMATNIPPHNLNEIMDACTAFVNARQTDTAISNDELFRIVPAPDFPTGGNILGVKGARDLYRTTNAGVIIRAATDTETIVVGKNKGITRKAIVVTELPYQVNKAALLEKIATLVNEKKLEGIADLRDESDRDGIRVVIELKRDAVVQIVLNNLYTKTALQSTFSGNFLALMAKDGGAITPQRFTLRQALDYFLDFRFETIRRQTSFRLSKVTARAHIVDGLLIALGKVNEVIDNVRAASDPKQAREALTKLLGTSSEQTDAILRLQLGQLTRLNKGKLDDEKSDLSAKKAQLQNLLDVDNAVYDAMKEEFQSLKKKFGTERKSKIIMEDDGEVTEVDLVKNSRSVIVVTRGGYIKRMPLKTFSSQNRGTRGKRGTSDGGDKAESEVAHCFTCNDHDSLLMVTQKGVAYGIRAFQVPKGGRIAKGQPISSVLPITSTDMITAILPVAEFVQDEYIVLATEKGWIKKTPLITFKQMSNRGLIITRLEKNDRLVSCHRCSGSDHILVSSSKGMASRFSSETWLNPTGRSSRGVTAMKLEKGDRVTDMDVISDDEDQFVIAITARGFGKRICTSEFRDARRPAKGVIAIKFKAGYAGDRLKRLSRVDQDDEILIITEKGIMVRQNVTDIPKQGRIATGVLIQRLDPGDRITSVSIVPEYEEHDAE